MPTSSDGAREGLVRVRTSLQKQLHAGGNRQTRHVGCGGPDGPAPLTLPHYSLYAFK